MAGKTEVGLVVLAGQTRKLALCDADSSCIRNVPVNANCANIIVAFFAFVRAGHALIIIKLKPFSAGSAFSNVGGLAVRTTIGTSSA